MAGEPGLSIIKEEVCGLSLGGDSGGLYFPVLFVISKPHVVFDSPLCLLPLLDNSSSNIVDLDVGAVRFLCFFEVAERIVGVSDQAGFRRFSDLSSRSVIG